MSEQNVGPTQTAYDRIQRAGTRNTIHKGWIVTHVIDKDGIHIRGESWSNGTMTAATDKIVGWSELALAKCDILFLRFEQVIREIDQFEEDVRTVA